MNIGKSQGSEILLGILPVISAMTADCNGHYLGLDGRWIDHAEGSISIK